MKRWVVRIGLGDKEEFSRSQIQRGEKFSRTEEILGAKADSIKIPDGLKNFSVARVFYSPWAQVEKAD